MSSNKSYRVLQFIINPAIIESYQSGKKKQLNINIMQNTKTITSRKGFIIKTVIITDITTVTIKRHLLGLSLSKKVHFNK